MTEETQEQIEREEGLERSGIKFGTTLGGLYDTFNYEAFRVLSECDQEGIFDLEIIEPGYAAKRYAGLDKGLWPITSAKDVKGIVQAVLYGSIPLFDRGIPETDHRTRFSWEEYIRMGKPKRIIREVRYRPIGD